MNMKRCCLLFLSLSLTACLGSQPTKYYLLTAKAAPSGKTVQSHGTLGVGPVNLPAYLDRKGIVTRQNEHELEVSDLHRWAESLDLNVARVIAESLRTEELGMEIAHYPWRLKGNIGKQIAIEISQFERIAGDSVVLVARTSSSSRSKKSVLRKEYQVKAPCSQKSYSGTAACMSKALKQFAGQIAQQIRAGSL